VFSLRAVFCLTFIASLLIPVDSCARSRRQSAEIRELNQMVARIDISLVTHAREQLRAYGRFISATAVHGVPHDSSHTRTHDQAPFPFHQHVKPGGMKIDMGHGGAVYQAGTLLRAYEMTGDSALLAAGLAYAEWLVKAQSPRGYWVQTYIIDPDGRTWVPWVDHLARIQDGSQSESFDLLLYAYKLTHERKYRDAAIQNADFVLFAQNDNGSWPDEFDFSAGPFEGAWTGARGIRVGGSYNDGATTNSALQMVNAWALTRDTKYLAKLGGIGQWIFDTRLGNAPVCGWCQQYDMFNKPIQARHFELPVIEPRTYVRFIVPHAMWFYAWTRDERYVRILREGYSWLRSVETPDGWAYQYLPDGTPVVSWQYRLLRFDEPDGWPADSIMGGHAEWKRFSRVNIHLGTAERVLSLVASGGADTLRALFNGPKNLEAAAFSWRTAAARRATDAGRTAQVRKVWSPGPNWKETTFPVWVYLDYLFDAKVARGEIPSSVLADRARGLGVLSNNQPAGSAWKPGLVHVDDWVALPIPNLR